MAVMENKQMSTDGTLPPGTTDQDINHHFGSNSKDRSKSCCQCFEELEENAVYDDMCNQCAAVHYRGLFLNYRQAYEELLRVHLKKGYQQ